MLFAPRPETADAVDTILIGTPALTAVPTCASDLEKYYVYAGELLP